jgi:hypothetical protein
MRLYISIISSLLLGSTLLSAQTPAPAQNVQEEAVSNSQAAAAPHGDITVNHFVLATGVASHEPQGIKEGFSTHDGRVFAFAELSIHGHDHVTFHWKHEGKTYAEFKAPVKNSLRWRTFGSVKALAGSWDVSLEDEHGNVLKELSFNVGHDDHQGAASAQPHAGEASEKAGLKEVLSSLEPAKSANAAQ